MALKDLPGSVVLNFKILLDQIDLYIRDVAEKSAGKEPPRPRGIDFSRLRKPWLSINQGTNPRANAQMEALYQTLKSSINVGGSVPTFNSKYQSTSVWKNNFFIIRTTVVGVVLPGDPALKAFDDLFNKLEAITGKWSWGK
jgi:hypothetical protein